MSDTESRHELEQVSRQLKDIYRATGMEFERAKREQIRFVYEGRMMTIFLEKGRDPRSQGRDFTFTIMHRGKTVDGRRRSWENAAEAAQRTAEDMLLQELMELRAERTSPWGD